jgi:hypothetical protein
MKEVITFSFLIPNQPEGKAKGNLSRLLQKLTASQVRLQSISASADRRRFKIYCAPEDPVKLRSFLKSAKIRAKERMAFFFEYKDVKGCLDAFDKIALSAFDVTGFDANVIGAKASGYMWSDKSFQ